MINRRQILKEAENRRRRRRRLKLYSFFLLVLLIVAFIVGLLRAEQLLITKVDIDGLKTIDQQEVLVNLNQTLAGKYFFLFPRKNILLVSKRAIAQNLFDVWPEISSMSIKRSGWQTLAITITERQPSIIWCQNKDNCFWADERGFVFKLADDDQSSEFKIIGLEPTINRRPMSLLEFEKMMATIKAIEKVLTNYHKISWSASLLEFKSEGDRHVFLRPATGQGWKIIFNRQDKPTDLATNLSIAINTPEFKEDLATGRPLDYIDLRFGNKVYYRLH